jgi:hypothetical protein
LIEVDKKAKMVKSIHLADQKIRAALELPVDMVVDREFAKSEERRLSRRTRRGRTDKRSSAVNPISARTANSIAPTSH